MRLPRDEGEQQAIYRSAIKAILAQLPAGPTMDAAAKHWLERDVARRFGALPPEVSARIDAIDDEDVLETLGERLDQVSSIAELFG